MLLLLHWTQRTFLKLSLRISTIDCVLEKTRPKISFRQYFFFILYGTKVDKLGKTWITSSSVCWATWVSSSGEGTEDCLHITLSTKQSLLRTRSKISFEISFLTLNSPYSEASVVSAVFNSSGGATWLCLYRPKCKTTHKNKCYLFIAYCKLFGSPVISGDKWDKRRWVLLYKHSQLSWTHPWCSPSFGYRNPCWRWSSPLLS